jgi:predicted DNA-binding transcriptional regulator YafY
MAKKTKLTGSQKVAIIRKAMREGKPVKITGKKVDGAHIDKREIYPENLTYQKTDKPYIYVTAKTAEGYRSFRLQLISNITY